MSRQNALILALLVSLSINLLIAGFVLGRSGGGPRPEPPPMGWVARELDKETRTMVRKRMREQLPVIRPLRQEMGRAMADVRKAVVARDYDAQALAEALARVRELSDRYQTFMHENLVEISQDLPRDQRIAISRAILERDGKAKMPGPPGR